MKYRIKETTIYLKDQPIGGEGIIELPEGSMVVSARHSSERVGVEGTAWAGFHDPEHWDIIYLEPVKE